MFNPSGIVAVNFNGPVTITGNTANVQFGGINFIGEPLGSSSCMLPEKVPVLATEKVPELTTEKVPELATEKVPELATEKVTESNDTPKKTIVIDTTFGRITVLLDALGQNMMTEQGQNLAMTEQGQNLAMTEQGQESNNTPKKTIVIDTTFGRITVLLDALGQGMIIGKFFDADRHAALTECFKHASCRMLAESFREALNILIMKHEVHNKCHSELDSEHQESCLDLQALKLKLTVLSDKEQTDKLAAKLAAINVQCCDLESQINLLKPQLDKATALFEESIDALCNIEDMILTHLQQKVVVQEPVTEPVQVVVQEPVTEPVQVVVQEPVTEPVQKPVQVVVQEPVTEATQVVAQEEKTTEL